MDTLSGVFQRDCFAQLIAVAAGFQSSCILGVVSKSINFPICCMLSRVDQLFPKRFYMIGGTNNEHAVVPSVQRFLSRDDAWETLPSMREARSAVVVVFCNGFIYICGGFDGQYPTNWAEKFDINKNCFEVLPNMMERRTNAVGGAVEGRVLVAGGHDGAHALNSVENFNADTNSWEPMSPMAERRAGAVAAFARDRFCVCGGRSDDGPEMWAPTGAYLNTACGLHAGEWDDLPAMSSKRWRAAGACDSKRIYVCGGLNESHQQGLSSIECLDPLVANWDKLADMQIARFGAVAFAMADRLYVFGGNDGVQRLKYACYLDMKAGSWMNIGALAEERGGAAGVLARL